MLFSKKFWKLGVPSGAAAIVVVAIFIRVTDRRTIFTVKVPQGEVSSVEFDPDKSELRLEYPGKQTVKIEVDKTARSPQFYSLEPPSGEPDTLRYLSKEFYASLGQKNDGLFLLGRDVRPEEIRIDPENKFAAAVAPKPVESAVDASFVAIKGLADRYNVVGGDRPVCTSSDARQLLQGLRSGSCYVVCSGMSLIADQLLPAPTRVVLLYSRTDKLDGGLSFLWSEWHTTLEVFSAGQWYVADPTYGFAYVKDNQGKRLSTEDLINKLAAGQAKELTFGVLNDDEIHDVSGDMIEKDQPTLAALYYTPDKTPTYLAISQPETASSSIKN